MIYEINLDLKQKSYFKLDVKQENDITIKANMYDGGTTVDVTNSTVVFNLLKGNKKIYSQSSNIKLTGNSIEIDIDGAKAFNRAGLALAEITIVKDSKQTTTFKFEIDVEASIVEGKTIDEDYISKVKELVDTIDTANKKLQELNNWTSQNGNITVLNTEVIESRNDTINNVQYPKLKDRLNAQSTDIKKLKDTPPLIENKFEVKSEVKRVTDQRISEYEFDLRVSQDFEFYNVNNYSTKGIVENGNLIIDTILKRSVASDKTQVLNGIPYELHDGTYHQFQTLMCNSSDQGSNMLMMFQSESNGDNIVKVDWSFRNQNNFQAVEGCAYLPIALRVKIDKTRGLNPSNLKTAIKAAKETIGVSRVAIMSDCHYFKDNNFAKKLRTFNNVIRNANCQVGISLGDNVTEYKTNYDKAQFLNIIDTFRKTLLENVLIAGGNHDTNSNREGVKQKAKQCMPNELFDAYMGDKTGINVTRDGQSGYYYFYDDVVNGVRYVILNTNDTPYIEQDSLTWKYSSFATPCIREQQIKWLCDTALQTDYDVVVMSHIGLLNETEIEGYDTIPKNVDLVRRILKGYKMKQKGNVSKVDGDFSVNADYDFTNRKGNIVASVFGHYHFQCKFRDADGLWHIGIDDMQGDTTNYNLTKPYLKDFLPRDYTDEKSTTVKIMMIDTNKKTCTLKNVGVGEDISFNY